jgi:hypothetical protein
MVNVWPKLRDELPDCYRAAGLNILLTWSERLPNVLRESCTCGTPFSRALSAQQVSRSGDAAYFH